MLITITAEHRGLEILSIISQDMKFEGAVGSNELQMTTCIFFGKLLVSWRNSILYWFSERLVFGEVLVILRNTVIVS